MADVLAYAPADVVDSLLSVAVPLVAAGAGLTLLFWFLGAVWQVVMSVFEL